MLSVKFGVQSSGLPAGGRVRGGFWENSDYKSYEKTSTLQMARNAVLDIQLVFLLDPEWVKL
jgi:hypothetical protein